MARIRTIKPEFFQDEDLAQCSAHARLLAIAVLQLCDANGVFRHIPMQVHAHAFPWEAEVNTPALLRELEGVGYLKFYVVDGREYGYIPGFAKHQRLQGKESASGGQYPRPKQALTNGEKSGDTRGSEGEYPNDSPGNTGTGNREQGTGNTSAASAAKDYPIEFERSWRKYPKRDGGNPKPRALKAWRARIKEGIAAADLESGVERYAAHVESKGKTGTEFVMQAATFFGPDEHWAQSYEAVAPKKEKVAWGDHMMVDFDAREADHHANG